jgi:hypothetical protein
MPTIEGLNTFTQEMYACTTPGRFACWKNHIMGKENFVVNMK